MKLLLSSDGFNENKLIFDEMIRFVQKRSDEVRIKLFSVQQTELDDYYLKLNIDLISDLGILKKNISVVNICKTVPQDAVQNLDVLYMCGGNTYHVLNYLRKGGYIKVIIDFIKEGGVYFGHSAGSTICGPDINIASVMDGDVNDINLKDTSGLNLIDFCIAPHYEERFREKLMDFKKRCAYRFTVLSNSQAISIDGNYISFIS